MSYLLKSGYVQLNTKKNRKKYEHRVVWEEHNGPIPKDCHIHHINGIKNDNRIENLMLIKNGDHQHKHHDIKDLRKKDIISKLTKGCSIKNLAKQLGVCRGTIYKRLEGIGIRRILKEKEVYYSVRK